MSARHCKELIERAMTSVALGDMRDAATAFGDMVLLYSDLRGVGAARLEHIVTENAVVSSQVRRALGLVLDAAAELEDAGDDGADALESAAAAGEYLREVVDSLSAALTALEG